MPGMVRPDLQALPQQFQLAVKVEHRALPDCRLIQQVYCKLKETAVQSVSYTHLRYFRTFQKQNVRYSPMHRQLDG